MNITPQAQAPQVSITEEAAMKLAQQVQDGDVMVLTRKEVETLISYLDKVTASQPKEEENGEVCQVLSGIFRRAHAYCGTQEHKQENCICTG